MPRTRCTSKTNVAVTRHQDTMRMAKEKGYGRFRANVLTSNSGNVAKTKVIIKNSPIYLSWATWWKRMLVLLGLGRMWLVGEPRTNSLFYGKGTFRISSAFQATSPSRWDVSSDAKVLRDLSILSSQGLVVWRHNDRPWMCVGLPNMDFAVGAMSLPKAVRR